MPTNTHVNNKYDVTIHSVNTVAGNPGGGLHVAELHITPKNSLDPVFAGDFKVGGHPTVYFSYNDQNGNPVVPPYGPRASSYAHPSLVPGYFAPTTDSHEYYFVQYATMQAPVQFPYWPNVAQVQMIEVYEDDSGNLINNEPVGDANYNDPTDLSQFLSTWVTVRTRLEDRGTVSLNLSPVFIRVFVFLHNLPDPLVQDVTEYIDLDLVPQAISVYGCTDPLAVNYSSSATIDDGSCTYLGCTNDNLGSWPDINGNNVDGNPCLGGTLFTTQPTGYNVTNYPCIDPLTGLANGYETVNFNPQAGADDGSCLIPVIGCGDDTYIEYDPNADFTNDTTSCITLIAYGCIDDSSSNSSVNPDINDLCIDGSSAVGGVCAPGNGYIAYNYDPAANVNEVSLTDNSNPCGYCTYYGCTDDTAFNYDASADCDDGSCIATITGCFDPQGNDPVTGLALSSNYNYLGTTGAINHDPSVNVVDNTMCYYFPGCTDSTDLTYYTQTYVTSNGLTTLMADTCTGVSVVDFDDGSCSTTTNFIAGCTDDTATNYLQTAVVDDCSCLYPNPIGGCMDDTVGDNPDINGDCTSTDPATGNVINVGYPNPYGCGAGNGYLSANYYPAANTSSITDPSTGVTTFYSCSYYGCMDPNADNYDATATIDDGSCVVYGSYYLHVSSNNSISAPHTRLNNSTTNNPTPDVHITATTMGNTLTGNGPSNGFIYNGVVDFANYEGFTYEDQNGNVLESTAFLFTLFDWEQFPLIFSTRPGYGNQAVDIMPLNQYLEIEAVLVVMGEIDIATLDPTFNSTAWYMSPHPSISFSGVNSDPTSPYFGTFEFSHGDVVDVELAGDPTHDPILDGPGYQFEIVGEYTGVERAEVISLLADQRQQGIWGGTQLDEYLSASNLSTTTGQVGYASYIKCKFYARNVSFDYATGLGQQLFGVNFVRPFQFVYKPGCMDVTDCSYWADATVDDPTLCSGTYYGCTDPLADNYDSLAGCDDGTCTYSTPCVTSSGNSNLGPGTFQPGSHGTIGYGLIGNVTPFSGTCQLCPTATNPTKTNVQEFDPSLVGVNMACNSINTYNNSSFSTFDNHRVFHADFTMLMVEGQLPSTTPLLTPDTAFWTLFTSQTSDNGTNNSSYTGNCSTNTTHNFWSRDHLNVGPMYRKWSSTRTRLYLKGMHDTYISSGLHGGVGVNLGGPTVDITSKINATPGTANGIPYGVHGIYLRLDQLDTTETYTFRIKYRYIPKWNNNYSLSDGADFTNFLSDKLRSHVRLGWGYFGTGGINSASDSNGNNKVIDYNGTTQGLSQTPPPSIQDWGGVAGNGPYHSLIEGRLMQRSAYNFNGTANITMYVDQVNFVPQHANNNVLMISIGNGFRLDIESIQVYCA